MSSYSHGASASAGRVSAIKQSTEQRWWRRVMEQPSTERLNVMTLEEVAEYLRVHPSTIYRLLKQRSLPAFKVGSDWRFARTQIDEWIIAAVAKQEAPPPAGR